MSALSILGLSLLTWILLALNPNWVYANKTQVDFVTIHHNQPLEEGTEIVIKSAIEIIKTSELFSDDISIDLCLNESFYPKLNPLVGKPFAYAMLDKTVLYQCKTNFKNNFFETQWAVNNFELRKFNLTWVLAHEFLHNLQNNTNLKYVIQSTAGTINWKLEGHAEYISRLYKNDGNLKKRIEKFLEEEKIKHNGIPVFQLEDGTQQTLSYFKYSLVIQYLTEQENMTYLEICNDKRTFDECYASMIEWHVIEE